MERSRRLERRLANQEKKMKSEMESMGGVMRMRGKNCRRSRERMENNTIGEFQRILMSPEAKERFRNVRVLTLREQIEAANRRRKDEIIEEVEVERYSMMSKEYLRMEVEERIKDKA